MPDIVFVANAGLVLPRLPEKVIIMSHMKFPSRQKETAPLKKAFDEIGFKTVDFPNEVFEGQGEAHWFHNGRLLLVGYGQRCTAKSVTMLRRLIGQIYRSYGVEPPMVIGVQLESPYLYHLDMAMLAVNATTAVVHEAAFSKASIRKLKTFVKLAQIRVDDPFCLNGICTASKLYVHTLNPAIYNLLKAITGLAIVENDVSEFEKAGGSVRCMVLSV
jgi:N-dimethylarginine dimethylaminohydrolase